MKYVIFSLLLATLPAAAQSPLTYKMVKEHRTFRHAKVDVQYPKLKSSALNAKIVELLPKPPDTSGLEAGEGIDVDEAFKVTYNNHGLLSIYGEGLSITVKDGHRNAAHP